MEFLGTILYTYRIKCLFQILSTQHLKADKHKSGWRELVITTPNKYFYSLSSQYQIGMPDVRMAKYRNMYVYLKSVFINKDA